MNEEFQKFLDEQNKDFTFPNDLPSYEPSDEELTELHEEAVKQTENLDKVFNNNELPAPPAEVNVELPEDDNTIIDEETGEVTTITKVEEPKLVPATTGYKAIVITLADDEEETKAEIEKRALTNPRLAEALKSGKKTWAGFFRFWHNQTSDTHRALGLGSGKPLIVHRERVWDLAEEYFTNDKLRDVNPATTAKAKKQPKPKAEKKPKEKSKVVPLTPQIGKALEKKEERKTDEGFKIEDDGQLSLF